ncbi:hypothetical protein SAMN02745898_101363 [Streptomyces sp. 136MFCol5.1]|nr:hypothetical protein SAMN02745898_101363 [Streptomyces sp. 136MFCol5.1]SFS41706.1 hypothetical protein SAMN04487982_101496 [Streptomyces sp. ok210]
MAGDASAGPRRPSLPAHTPPAICRPVPSPDRIVDRAVDEDALRSSTIEIAEAQVSKAADTLGTIKARMYAPALAAPREKGNPLG